jgi:hypothetical protein
MIRWLEFPVDQYLVQRHPNWVLAEEFGDVRFSGETVFVNRERAEHIAQMLLGGRDALVLEDARPCQRGPASVSRACRPLSPAGRHRAQ